MVKEIGESNPVKGQNNTLYANEARSVCAETELCCVTVYFSLPTVK